MSFEKIRKLLNLTRSDNDSEALVAIRRANAILEANDMTWDDFFDLDHGAAATPFDEPQRPKPRPLNDEQIEHICFLGEEILKCARRATTIDFVQGLMSFARVNRQFSEKQWNAFKRTYEGETQNNFDEHWDRISVGRS